MILFFPPSVTAETRKGLRPLPGLFPGRWDGGPVGCLLLFVVPAVRLAAERHCRGRGRCGGGTEDEGRARALRCAPGTGDGGTRDGGWVRTCRGVGACCDWGRVLAVGASRRGLRWGFRGGREIERVEFLVCWGLFWKGLRSVCSCGVDLIEMEGCCGRTGTGDEGWGRIAEGCYGKRMLSDWVRSGFSGDRGFNRSTNRI